MAIALSRCINVTALHDTPRLCATGILPVLGHGQDGHGTPWLRHRHASRRSSQSYCFPKLETVILVFPEAVSGAMEIVVIPPVPPNVTTALPFDSDTFALLSLFR